jgi:hypothetical protein
MRRIACVAAVLSFLCGGLGAESPSLWRDPVTNQLLTPAQVFAQDLFRGVNSVFDYVTFHYAVKAMAAKLHGEVEACRQTQCSELAKLEELETKLKFEIEGKAEMENALFRTWGLPAEIHDFDSLVEAIRTGSKIASEREWQDIEIDGARKEAERHCHTLYDPMNRIYLMPAADRSRLMGDPKRWSAFGREWNARIWECTAKIAPEALWAQHVVSITRCFNAHDWAKANRPNVPQSVVDGEHKAYDACMNQNDIITSYCTQDRRMLYRVEQQRSPDQAPAMSLDPCPGEDISRPPNYRSRSPYRDGAMVVRYRGYGDNPDSIAMMVKVAGSITPAVLAGAMPMGPAPKPSTLPQTGEPLNALGVPVGARLTIVTQEPIDLVRTTAAQRYRARLDGPAVFKDKSYLSSGVEVFVRVRRNEQVTSKGLLSAAIASDYAVVVGRRHALPSGELPILIRLDSQSTTLPPQSRYTLTLTGTLPEADGDTASAERQVPVPQPAVPQPSAGTASAGGRIRAQLRIAVVTVDAIDPNRIDGTGHFRAHAAEAVLDGGTVLIPKGADVSLKVVRTQPPGSVPQMAIEVESAFADGRRMQLSTEPVIRREAASSPRSIPNINLPGGRRLPIPAPRPNGPAGNIVPAGTQLVFRTI